MPPKLACKDEILKCIDDYPTKSFLKLPDEKQAVFMRKTCKNEQEMAHYYNNLRSQPHIEPHFKELVPSVLINLHAIVPHTVIFTRIPVTSKTYKRRTI